MLLSHKYLTRFSLLAVEKVLEFVLFDGVTMKFESDSSEDFDTDDSNPLV